MIDDGAPIPEDQREAISESYVRGHHVAGQPPAVGLGLKISRLLARRIGGNLTYGHEDGHGLFELRLPAPPGPRHPDDPSPA